MLSNVTDEQHGKLSGDVVRAGVVELPVTAMWSEISEEATHVV